MAPGRRKRQSSFTTESGDGRSPGEVNFIVSLVPAASTGTKSVRTGAPGTTSPSSDDCSWTAGAPTKEIDGAGRA